VLIAGAAAEVPRDPVPDLTLGRLWVVVQQVDRGHDHARRAEAALQAVLLPEALLHRVELVVLGEALDRGHLRPIRLDSEDGARLCAASVDEHRARAALTRVAAHVRARQMELLAKEVDEQHPRLHVRLARLTIDDD
jgi:hypothetical protein